MSFLICHSFQLERDMTLINRRQFSLATALAPLSVTDAFAQAA
jgi:hypothetical protein